MLASGEVSLGACPDEDDFLAWLAGPRRASDSIERHYDRCPACQEVARLLRDSALVPRSGSDEQAAPLHAGQTVGRYVVLERVGAGGMGTVYAAYDPELDRKVALKILRARRSAVVEARALAKITHPNVLHVYEAGSVGELVFVAMELVTGTTLAEWSREPRSQREILAALLAAGRGLAAVHAAGIVHRDFKPHNVLVSHEGHVFVSDFGLALLPADEHRGAAGTPFYMAPELASGRVDARSDQFSFGVVAWEALYGARPSAAKTRPSRAVPKEIYAALCRALDDDPARRFPSMDALLAALDVRRRLRAQLGIGAALACGVAAVVAVAGHDQRAATCTGDRLAGVWDAPVRARVSRAFAASGATADALQRIEKRVDAYAQRWATMRTDACTARDAEPTAEVPRAREGCLDERGHELAALRDELVAADTGVVDGAARAVEALGSLDDCASPASLWPWRTRVGTPLERAETDKLEGELARVQVESATRGADKALPLLAPLAARIAAATDPVLRYEGNRLLTRATFASPAADRTALAALSAAEASGSTELVARAWTLRAQQAYSISHFDEADDDLAHATNLLDGIKDHANARVQVEGAWVESLYDQYRLDDAQAHVAAFLALDAAAGGPTDADSALAYFQSAAIAEARGEYADAQRLAGHYLDYITELEGARSPRAALALVVIAVALERQHHGPEALAAIARALASVDSGDPWLYATTVRQAARVIAELGDVGGARELLGRVTARVAEGLQPARSSIAAARIALVAGDDATAIDAAERATAGFAQGGNAAMTSIAKVVLGRALLARGDDDGRALAVLQDAFAQHERARRQWPLEDELALYGSLGAALVDAGRADEARAILQRGLESSWAKEDWMAHESAVIHAALARACAALGHADDAALHTARAAALSQQSTY